MCMFQGSAATEKSRGGGSGGEVKVDSRGKEDGGWVGWDGGTMVKGGATRAAVGVMDVVAAPGGVMNDGADCQVQEPLSIIYGVCTSMGKCLLALGCNCFLNS